jgi:hexosaminidase
MTTTLPIIPMPRSVVLGDGTFPLNAHTQVVCDEAVWPEGQYLAEYLSRAVGSAISLHTDAPRTENVIALRFAPYSPTLGKEGYRLTVAPGSVTIQAVDRAGVFYGIQTLRQLGTDLGACHIPCVEIEDSPRFGWRGAMLDVVRHFLPMEFVLKFIDLLALHKMNVLHLHLTDDQGWRLEIKKYPKLTSVGAIREKTLIGRALSNPADPNFDPKSQRFDDQPYGGYYTQEQAREIVAYAAARHITVVPEIEMPGHAQSAIAAYPELGCMDESVEVSPIWGIHDVLYKPTERTFAFLRDVFAEVMELFPSRYLHIGGDEAVKTQWRNSPECQALKRELGLADEEAMQSYFIGRMDEYIASQGRILVGWDEILEGGLSPGAVVMSWRGEEGGVEAAGLGHDVVMAPHRFTYFDYYQSEDRSAEPLAFPEFLPLSKVYAYEPIPSELAPDRAYHVLGAQCQLWSEYMPNARQVEYQAFPRLSALAEVTWSSREAKDYDGFLERLRTHMTRLQALGVNARPFENNEIFPGVETLGY